jgi:glycosyltransferase involved in cell wall biosynthesis
MDLANSVNNISIIIPSYTGANTLPKTFESILGQKDSGKPYELIVIIDGPNRELNELASKYKTSFTEKGVNFRVRSLKKNKGRFNARLIGAEIAKYRQLLFVDDRVQLGEDYLSYLQKTKQKIAMANVIELPSGNIISITLYALRRKIYGKKWGQNFEDFYVTKDNFESSPKGTTSLWVDKEIFMKACEEVSEEHSGNSRFINEDTKILRKIVNDNYRIFKTSNLNVRYQPRDEFKDAVRHLYERGPRFVDYYLKPGTRFFPLLFVVYLSILVTITLALWEPLWLAFLYSFTCLLIIVASVVVSTGVKEYLTIAVGLPIVGLIFTAGVVKGTLVKLASSIN